jgi:hypothetical protein
LAAVLHEMVHLANAEAGLRDVHPSSGYHNRHFKREAEARGLLVKRDGHRGWCETRLAAGTQRLIQHDFRPDRRKFATFRPEEARAPAPTKLRLWMCACPVRARIAVPDLDWTCNRCGTRIARVERTRER